MNDKDKEAYAIYESTILDREGYLYIAREAWQAACEWKQHEVDAYREATRTEAEFVNELQEENKALRSNINGSKMKQMNERIEKLLAENASLIEKVQRVVLFLKEDIYAYDDKDELFVNKYCVISLLQELEKANRAKKHIVRNMKDT